jgi:hypothetical protein
LAHDYVNEYRVYVGGLQILEASVYSLAEINWEAIFQPGNMVFFVAGMGIMIPLVAVIGGIYQNIKKHQREVLLKRDLVAGGYSADEIERVVKAKSEKK